MIRSHISCVPLVITDFAVTLAQLRTGGKIEAQLQRKWSERMDENEKEKERILLTGYCFKVATLML